LRWWIGFGHRDRFGDDHGGFDTPMTEETLVTPNLEEQDEPVAELHFANNPLELRELEKSFYEGLSGLADKFHREIKAYGDGYKMEINTKIQFELVKS
jgi:hypothetical protein